MNGTADFSKYTSSLQLLSEVLDDYHGRRPFLLADAYDTPLKSTYTHGFYDEMADCICNMFEDVCKTNPHLERAVLTGIMNVKAKSAISGFNNFTNAANAGIPPTTYISRGFLPCGVRETHV